MSIKYDLFSTPSPNGKNEKPYLHARPVVSSTVSTDDLVYMISSQTSFTAGDIKGILESLAENIYVNLSNSRNVCLDGIGIFSLSLTCPPATNKKEIRANKIKVKRIQFRANPELKNKFKTVSIEKVQDPKVRFNFDPEKRKQRILWDIERYESINKTNARLLNQVSNKIATKDLDELISANKIKALSCGRRTIYMAGEESGKQ